MLPKLDEQAENKRHFKFIYFQIALKYLSILIIKLDSSAKLTSNCDMRFWANNYSYI